MATATVSVKTIIAMLARSHKTLVLPENDIAEWCGECLEEIGEFTAMTRVRDLKLTITNNIAELPCNVFRVLHVNQGLNTPAYSVDHPYIKFKRYSGEVTVDALLIPTDDDGYPVIDRKARQACYWFCRIKLGQEDFDNGKISAFVWNDWATKEEYYIDRARGNMGNMSRDDLNGVTKIMYSMVSSIFMPNSLD